MWMIFHMIMFMDVVFLKQFHLYLNVMNQVFYQPNTRLKTDAVVVHVFADVYINPFVAEYFNNAIMGGKAPPPPTREAGFVGGYS